MKLLYPFGFSEGLFSLATAVMYSCIRKPHPSRQHSERMIVMYLRQIGKKWYFAITIVQENGEKKRIEKVGGYTKTEAKQAAMQILRKQDRFGRVKWLADIKVKDYLDEWFNDYVKVYLVSNTQDNYENVIENHIKPDFGNKKLHTITPIFLQKYLNNAKEKYSKKTLAVWLSLLKRAFEDAVVMYDYLDKNPAKNVRLPKYEEITAEKKPFTKKELDKIFEYFTEEHKIYIPIMIAYFTGMRVGEILALTWDDIDFSNNTIHVHQNQYDKKGTPIISGSTKTKRSRQIVICQALAEILKKHSIRQKRFQLLYGKEYHSSNAVCTKADGTKLTSINTRFFGLWCKKNNIDGSFHTLRHTHTVMLLENGCDIDYVSKRLGHSTIRTTADVYSHITEKRNSDALEVMEKCL